MVITLRVYGSAYLLAVFVVPCNHECAAVDERQVNEFFHEHVDGLAPLDVV